MELRGSARRVRIYVNEGDRVQGKSAHQAIVAFLRSQNVSGATLFHAMEGFGASGEIHHAQFVEVPWNLPVVVEWVDTPERVDRLLDRLKQMVIHGMITVEDTQVVHYVSRPVRDITAATTAGELVTGPALSVLPEEPLDSVARQIVEHPHAMVVVVDDMGRPVGVITGADLAERAGPVPRMELFGRMQAQERDAALDRLAETSRVARDVMTSPAITVTHSTPLTAVAENLIRRNIKRVAVVDDTGRLHGAVGRVDLLRAAAPDITPRAGAAHPTLRLEPDLPIGQLTLSAATVLPPEANIHDVFRALVESEDGIAVVADADRRPLGVITEAEALERVTPSLRPSALSALLHRMPFAQTSSGQLALDQHARARTARDLMRADVARLPASTPVKDALPHVRRGHDPVVIVVDERGQLVGVVDRDTVVHGLLAGASPDPR